MAFALPTQMACVPWDNVMLRLVDQDRRHVCSVIISTTDYQSDEERLGALLAASPELLQACRRALDWFVMPHEEYWNIYGRPESMTKEMTLVGVLESVVAKATVRQAELALLPPSDNTQGSLFE